MYELIVIACLINQPVRCEEFYLPFQEAASAARCAQDAELQLVQWVAERPEWQIRRWTCGPQGMRQQQHA